MKEYSICAIKFLPNDMFPYEIQFSISLAKHNKK